MQYTELRQQLEQKYNVLAVTWLEDLACQPSSTLYRAWQPCLTNSYQPAQRFVLLNFRPVSQDVLDHATWLIEYLDISPCFVLVVTNQTSTADWFLAQPNPVEVQQISQIVPHFLPIHQTVPQFNTNNQMCAHAWTGLHVWPNGETSVCCDFQDVIRDQHNQAFNIKSHTISEILSSDYMNQVRDQFRQGQKLTACQNCWRNEQAGGESKHQLTTYKLSNIYPRIDWESNSLDRNMGFIGGHLGNLCNLKCRICSPVFSSSIAAEEIGQEPDIETRSHPTYKLLTDNRWRGNSEKFWQQLKDHSDQICNFEFLGGEPLLLQENLDFMQWLVDNGHSHKCIFEFISNGTQYPAVFDRASQFHRLTVTLSIDNLQQRFESERYGADWDQVVANLQRFVSGRDYGSNIKIGVCITVNIQNVLYLPELIKWLKSQGIDHYYYNVLAKPEWISIDWLTPEARTLVIDRLVSADLPADDRVKLFYVINCVRSATTSDGAEFRKQMQFKDQTRHQNFILTHQEIAQAMGFVLQSQDD